MSKYRPVDVSQVRYSKEVTAEVLTAAESIYDGWYADAPRIDWTDFLDRLDGMTLDDGSTFDLGGDFTSSGVRRIKAHVKRYAQQG